MIELVIIGILFLINVVVNSTIRFDSLESRVLVFRTANNFTVALTVIYLLIRFIVFLNTL